MTKLGIISHFIENVSLWSKLRGQEVCKVSTVVFLAFVFPPAPALTWSESLLMLMLVLLVLFFNYFQSLAVELGDS